MKATHLAAAAAVLLLGVVSLGAHASNASAKANVLISPALLSAPGDGPGGCVPGNGAGSDYTCHVTLSNPGTVKLDWATESLDNGQLDATVTPNSGSLAPGKSVRVTIITADCGFYLADLANFLSAPSAGGSIAADPTGGGSVLFSCG